MRWLLPEAIEDVLPAEARQVEALRRRLMDMFESRGYEFVMPPMLEYLDSLLTGSGRDLDLRTFKLVDQLSGRTMGVRADITPQVARIDAHLLNRSGVARLCYCGSVLHTLPAGLTASREPVQLGAELYGHAGLEADEEIIRLLADALHTSGVQATRIDLGHVGLFRILTRAAGIEGDLEESVFAALQAKDLPELRTLTKGVSEDIRAALLALPELYGGVELLEQARRRLPPVVQPTLDELGRLAASLRDLPISFDLSDLRGYHYHSGVVFAAYCAGAPGAIALGGRYDMVGRAYGRARPATGYSLDLRELARLANGVRARSAILAPFGCDAGLLQEVQRLREAGEIVIAALPGHEGTWHEAGCDRQLVQTPTGWTIEAIKKD